jgi:hypothetical protein
MSIPPSVLEVYYQLLIRRHNPTRLLSAYISSTPYMYMDQLPCWLATDQFNRTYHDG